MALFVEASLLAVTVSGGEATDDAHKLTQWQFSDVVVELHGLSRPSKIATSVFRDYATADAIRAGHREQARPYTEGASGWITLLPTPIAARDPQPPFQREGLSVCLDRVRQGRRARAYTDVFTAS